MSSGMPPALPTSLGLASVNIDQPDELNDFVPSEFCDQQHTDLANLQADVDILKRSMKEHIDREIRQARTSMEGRIDAINRKNADLEHDLTRLAAKLEVLREFQNALGSQSQRAQSVDGRPTPNVAVATPDQGRVLDLGEAMPKVSIDDPRAELESYGLAEKNQHDHMTWRKAKAQQITNPQYKLNESVWDVCLLVGINIIHPADEIIVMVAGLCNLVVQLLFLAIVAKIAGKDNSPANKDMPDKMLTWRITYAHDPKYANALQDKPLSMMVCEMDPTNMEGIEQGNIYKVVNEYLSRTLFFQIGPVLCILCVFLWLLRCFKEAGSTLRMCQGVWCSVHHSGLQELNLCRRFLSAKSGIIIKASERGIAECSGMVSKPLIFHASLARGCVVTLLIILPRLGILSFLSWYGIQYLVATIELEELILNAVALEVVLRVDEMLYDIFVPAASKMILSKAHPLPLLAWEPVVGSVQPYMKVFFMSVILVLITFKIVQPQLGTLNDVDHVMCDGNTEFFASESTLGIVFAGKPNIKPGKSLKAEYKYKAVLQKTDLQPENGNENIGNAESDPFFLDSDVPLPMIPAFPIGTVKLADRSAEITVAEIMNLPAFGGRPLEVQGVNCLSDYAWSYDQNSRGATSPIRYRENAEKASKKFLQLTLGDAPNCSFAWHKEYCLKRNQQGVIARFFCVVSCQLNDPQSGNIWISTKDGVAYHCGYVTNFVYFGQHQILNTNLQKRMPKVLCEDVPKTDPAMLILAKSFSEYFDPIYAASLGPQMTINLTKIQAQHITVLIETWGCQAIAQPDFHWTLLNPGPPGSPHVEGQYPQPGAALALFCNPAELALQSYQMRSFRSLCPMTCDCHGEGLKWKEAGRPWTVSIGVETQCPSSCFNYTV